MLPIDFEIEKRQLMYLHRILQLDPSDPVSQMFWQMTALHEAGEKNWWSGIKPCLEKYGLPSLQEIQQMSKDCLGKKVKAVVTETALCR